MRTVDRTAPSAASIRADLRAGRPSIGSWAQIPDASVAELLARAGYDWVAVDLEHGSIGVESLPGMFRAIEVGGAVPFARVAEAERKDIKQALDAGARGIVLPMIERAEQLKDAVDACLYPPAGRRGVGFARANAFGAGFAAGLADNSDVVIVAQIEHVDALADLDRILSTERLDAIMIGPYDLSASLGVPGEFEHAGFQAALQRIFEVARRHRVATGLHVVMPDPSALERAVQDGHAFLAYGTDGVFLWHGARRPAGGRDGGGA